MRRTLLTVLLSLLLLGPLPAAPQNPAQQPDVTAGEISRPDWPQGAVRAPYAMVVSDEALASEAGIEMLKKGGNAVDAAVAVGFALAVVWPAAGNIGGGGFMLIRTADGQTNFLDYREVAPGRATRNMYLRADGSVDPEGPTKGYRAVGVPGTVAGLELALRRYGTMKLADVMAPAIRLAEQGFPVSERLARSLRAAHATLQRFSTSRRIFLKDGSFYQPGDILRQPELAATLRRIVRGGAAEFYRGQTARLLADEMRAMGGLISLEDLAAYQPKFREPLRAKYSVNGAEWELILPPLPSSGGIAVMQALNILAPIELKSWNEAQSVHWVAETMRRTFADRAAFLGDPDFVQVPWRGLTDPRYAAERRATIDPQHASSSAQIGPGNPAAFQASESTSGADWIVAGAEGEHTTHFSVVDAAGNAVSNTYTLNDSYGSGVTTSAGFLLNNEMDDFAAKPGEANLLFKLVQSEANAIAPGKRPLSSMTPTIVLRDGKLSFVTGSPGGPRIISATLLSILWWMRTVSHDAAGAQEAINAPRFHHQWMPDELRVEATFPPELRAELERRGHKVVVKSWIGQVEAIGIDPRTGERLGAADPRRQGAAIGY